MAVVTASIAIDAKPQDVMAILLALTDYPSWQSGVEKIVIEDSDEQGRPRRTRWHVSAMGLRASHTVGYEYPAADCFAYHLVESEVMTQYDFSCAVTKSGDGMTEVMVSQELGIKWAMPRALLDKNAQKGLNKMLMALKSKAEQGTAREIQA